MTLLVTSSVAVFEAVIRAKLNVCDNFVTENQKKKKIWKSKKLFIYKSRYKRWFMSGIHSLPRGADARGNANIFYRMYKSKN